MTCSTCWRCLVKASYSFTIPVRFESRCLPLLRSQSRAQFTTTTRLAHPAPKAKRPRQGKDVPKRGVKSTFLKKAKKNMRAPKGRPPAPGERKALRKRIVLSNTNALEVHGMQDLSAESMIDMRLRGQVIGIPGLVVDQLRAVEAFKVSQAWGLFRTPGMLMRRETVEYGKMLEDMSSEEVGKTVRRVLVGERGSGKSMLLLQAMSMAFIKKWAVFHIPAAQDLSNGHTEYCPLPSTSPTQYIQQSYIATLLSSIASANHALLSSLTLSTDHPSVPIPLQSNMSLERLARLGAADPEIAWPVFLALWTELTTKSTSSSPRPKIFLGLDGLGHIMNNTAYMSADFKPIHAHDLALVKWYLDYLSSAKSLPNGGLVLATTSESNDPNVRTLKLKLAQLEAQQDPTPSVTPPLDAPFLLATASSLLTNSVPRANTFGSYDERVMNCFGKEGIDVQRIKGLSKEEARGLMEYWAKSGILRQTVSEGLVGEKWTISGGGVIGELERGCLRMRI
ncbi:37S ribosomal protein S23 mitochondrial [Schaereria dolodes]|nr:37S ribosomal protein S23 mitochondrial [Schaereria dolodes]